MKVMIYVIHLLVVLSTWLPEESHAEIDVVLAVADMLPSVLEQPDDSFADDMEE